MSRSSRSPRQPTPEPGQPNRLLLTLCKEPLRHKGPGADPQTHSGERDRRYDRTLAPYYMADLKCRAPAGRHAPSSFAPKPRQATHQNVEDTATARGCGRMLLRLRPHPSRRFAPQDEVNIFNSVPQPEETGPSRRRLAAAPQDDVAVFEGRGKLKSAFFRTCSVRCLVTQHDRLHNNLRIAG
jgi:hypothetical protein